MIIVLMGYKSTKEKPRNNENDYKNRQNNIKLHTKHKACLRKRDIHKMECPCYILQSR